MVGRRYLRFFLFCVGSAALLIVGLGLRAEGDSSGADTASGEPFVAVAGPRVDHEREERQLRRDARSFLSAFLRYEEGELSRHVRRALRAGASEEFASELLRAPPRFHEGLPAARIDRVFIKEASWEPTIAVIGGVARRAQRREKLSFLFARSEGRWHAAGPAP